MSKFMASLALLFIFISITPTSSYAGDRNNYLQLRIESGNGIFGTRALIENNSLESWTIGARIGTSKNSFTYFNPYALYKIGKFQIGSIYMRDSLGEESIGPIIRYADTFGEVSTSIEYSYNVDTHGNNNLHDLWWSISQNKKMGWKIGAEAWYYHYAKDSENLKIRPLKISYIVPGGITPFIMLQRHWSDKKPKTDAILCGIELKF